METRNKSMSQIIISGFKTNINQYAMFIALIVVWLIFQVLSGGEFITPRNLSNLLGQNVYIAILAVGMVLIMVAGHIDLSVGWLGGTSGAVAAMAWSGWHWNIWAAIALALSVGILTGLWQGFWVAYRGVPAFIVTLGSFLMFHGFILLAVHNGQTVPVQSGVIYQFGSGFLPQLFLKGTVGKDVPFHDLSLMLGVLAIVLYWVFEFRSRANRLKFGFDVLPWTLQLGKIILVSVLIAGIFAIQTFYVGMSYAFLFLILLALLFVFITTKTVFGRHIYAIGGNKEAAKLSGINIRSRTMWVFIIMGTLASVAGLVFTGRMASASPAAGNLWELDTIAAVVVGGTSTLGGEGTIIGAIIGALFMGSLNNGMYLLNWDIQYQYIIKGVILTVAVWFDITSKKRR